MLTPESWRRSLAQSLGAPAASQSDPPPPTMATPAFFASWDGCWTAMQSIPIGITTSAFALTARRMQVPQPSGFSCPSQTFTFQPTSSPASFAAATGFAQEGTCSPQETTQRLTPALAFVAAVGGVPVAPLTAVASAALA